jgi:hypothetical protein
MLLACAAGVAALAPWSLLNAAPRLVPTRLSAESTESRLAPASPQTAKPTTRLPVPSTPTRLDFFEAATGEAGGLTVTWRTIYERALVGFDLYRQGSRGDWVKVTPTMIAASNHIAGGVYRVPDPGAARSATVTYKLVEWDEAATAHEISPVTLAVRPVATPLAELNPPPSPPRREAKSLLTDGAPPVPVGAGPRYAKFVTSQAGLHLVSASTIASLLGESVATVRGWLLAGSVGLYSRGQAVGFVPSTDGSSLYFYATAYADNYTSQNVYWLTALTNPVPSVVPGGSPAPVTGIFDQVVLRVETNSTPAPTTTANPDDDYWFWARILSNPGFNLYTFPVSLSHVVTTAGQPRLKVWLHGGSSTSHGANIAFVGNLVSATNWQGLQPVVVEGAMDPAWLREGTNLIRVTVSNLALSVVYLNKLELQYPRLYRATNGTLEFTANSNAVVTAGGFTSGVLSVVEVTDPLRPAVVTDFTVAGGGADFSASLVPSRPDARYVAFQANGTLPQPAASAVTLAGLSSPTNNAQFILVAPAFLAATAEELAIYRRGQGLPSRVVTVESIYDEFNYGLPSPYSLREFFSRAYTNWATRPLYVALLGDGSYDYRNLLGYNAMQVPSLMLPTSLGLYGSDTLLGDFNGDNMPELAMGRLPTRTPAQLLTVINKIKAYEAQGLRADPRSLLLSDFPDAAGNFPQDIAYVGLTLTNKYSLSCVYTSTVAQMRTETISNLNSGVDLMVYLGHGALNRFGTSSYLNITNIPALSNSARLPLVSVMTCVAGDFAQPGNNCIAEELVLAANGGAIAVIGPTGLSANQDATLLNQRLMRVLRTEDWGRLGDFWRQAAAEYTYYDQRPMGISIYNLIGDPTLRFAISRPPPPPRIR